MVFRVIRYSAPTISALASWILSSESGSVEAAAEVVKDKGRQGRRRRLQGTIGRGTLEKERPPVFGMMQRGGQVVVTLLANVMQKRSSLLSKILLCQEHVCIPMNDEYSIYVRMQTWRYDHKHVIHGRGEFARDDDGDDLCEVHVHTIEEFWSLLRSWLRPHWGISQEKLPVSYGQNNHAASRL